MPSADAVFSAKHRVFAHYFNRYPLSLDNKPWQGDYYTAHYLSKTGEHGKWLAQGGLLRTRPLPVEPGPVHEYKLLNLQKEIRLALSRGISGFMFDVLSPKDVAPHSYLADMLEAVAAVDPRFNIVLMPDMAALKHDTGKVEAIVKAVYHHPGLHHMTDGRLLIAPFLSESVTPDDWAALKASLAKQGYPIAIMPTFLSLKKEYIANYQEVSDGFGTFGTPVIRQGDYIPRNIKAAHVAGKPYMAGISGQGYRPKQFLYWEAGGSEAYRKGWEGAIGGDADWVQLTTWNDFSESTQIEPYTDAHGASGNGYFHLTGYYAAWFITGHEPVITQDVLYYFYRKQPVNAATVDAKQTVNNPAGGPGRDIIELLGFLKSPGTLVISIAGHEYKQEAGVGLQSFKIPLTEGIPAFSLVRGNSTVISFAGDIPIANMNGLPEGHTDLTYWSGSATADGRCVISLKPER